MISIAQLFRITPFCDERHIVPNVRSGTYGFLHENTKFSKDRSLAEPENPQIR